MSRVGTLSRSLLAALAGLLLLTPGGTFAANNRQQLDEESEARLRKDIFFIASPACEGRGPGTKGIDLAADYIASEFKKIGLKPGWKGNYFQPFGVAGAVGKLTLAGPQGQRVELQHGLHFLPLGNDQQGKASAPVVFAGYGLSCSDPAYDDYDGLDVTGKIVVILRDTPRPGDRTKEMASGAPFASKLVLAQKK